MALKQRLVANVVLDGRVGGPQLRIAQLVPGLRARGIETIVVFPRMGEQLPELLQSRGIRFECIELSRMRVVRPLTSLLKYLIRLPLESWSLARLCRRNGVVLVHANGLFCFQAVLAAGFLRVPCVWHFNDTSLSMGICRLWTAAFGWMAPFLAYSAGMVMQHYGARPCARTALLYPPVDEAWFDPAAVHQAVASRLAPFMARAPGEITILAVGNINPLKGYEYLLQAVARLKAAPSSWRLRVVGAPLDTNPKYFAQLQALVRAFGLEQRVAFVGMSMCIREAMALADFLVLPSIAEAAPMVVTEALAMGKPVIATRVGFIGEVIRDGFNGKIVAPCDPDALAEAIDLLLADEELRDSLARNARASVVPRFSIQRAVDAHYELYCKAIG